MNSILNVILIDFVCSGSLVVFGFKAVEILYWTKVHLGSVKNAKNTNRNQPRVYS